MRNRWHAVRRRVAQRPRLWLAGGLIAAILLVVGSAFVFGQSKPTNEAIRPTTTERWTLVELTSQIEAGNVLTITVGAGDSNTPMLLAQNDSRQYVAISVNGTIADATSALASLGYRDLLSPVALSTAESRTASGGGWDAIRIITTLVMLGTVIGLGVWMIVRARGSRISWRGVSSGKFATVMPAEKRQSSSPTLLAASPQAAPAGSADPVRLADVAGCDEAKLELSEAIDFLRDPERFRDLGARVPRGIMLYGPPGTGKTMLARAVATEADVPFHHASGSDFVEKYVGMGARRVRDLFAQSRKLGKGVIFIDEFDALGKARGGPNSHEEREQTLNQLLVELDGFGTSADIVVIAATNRLDTLDDAVLRPGRFSRKVHVGLPDVGGRKAILDVHSRGKPLGHEVDIELLARKTYGFSGAQLADLLNEAAIMAARRSGDTITNEDLHNGWLKVAVGTGRRRSMTERDRAIIAAHEVGHALCGKVHGDTRRVEEISLFAHGEALGVTVSSQEDNDLPAESDLRARLVALMGGRAAEELLFHQVTPGAANDFEKATQIATSMVHRWGMGRDPRAAEFGTSGRGTLSFIAAKRDGTLPTELQAAATRAIAAILDEAYDTARNTLIDKLDILRRIGVYLVQQERIDGDTFDALYEGKLDVPDAQSEWRPAAARPREWAAITAMAISNEKFNEGSVGASSST
ncbi:MAG TPA: AAA family ATPase [Candidatus Limnocylindrales bacterium]|nr:AAA family ATPase [Candidatus Limnocylindrales bacterium]